MIQLHSGSELCALSAVELVRMIRTRAVSSREVVKAFLDQIDALNPMFNAIVSLRERAEILTEADVADAAVAAGAPLGALHGLPMAVKDLAAARGLRTSWGSPIFVDFIATEDELFVARQRKAGAIFIGKTNAPEFGLGSHTFNSVFGATRNAYEPSRSAGGSSGGAAVALALRMLPLADGSDLGGSLRNPAAFNNVLGLRPSQGRVPGFPSRDLFFSQLSTDGPMARSIEDLSLLLGVQAGPDPRTPLALTESFRAHDDPMAVTEGCRIGWLRDLDGRLPIEPGILELCESALERLAASGCAVDVVSIDTDVEALWQAFVVLRQYQAGTSLKVHYDNPARRVLLKPEAIWEVEGLSRLSAGDVAAAAQTRSAWFAHLAGLFHRFDYLVLPSAQVFPFPVEWRWPQEIAGRKMDSYHRWMQVVTPATLSGCPTLNVPAGFLGALPMGMQIIGRPRRDDDVLALGARYEAVNPWIDALPPVLLQLQDGAGA